jgi:hypothetical protein
VRSVPPDVKRCSDVSMVMWARNFSVQEQCSDQVNVFIHCFCTRYGTLYVRDARSPPALHHINKKACRATTSPDKKEGIQTTW